MRGEGAMKKRHELTYIDEIGEDLSSEVEKIDLEKSSEELEMVLAAAIRKLHLQVKASTDFAKGEVQNLERITAAFTKMNEDKRKQTREEDSAELNPADIVNVLSESIKALPESQREALLNQLGGKDEE